MNTVVGLGDIAKGAAALCVDQDGRLLAPLSIVDLDNADWSLGPAAVRALRSRTGVVVGTCSVPLPADATELLSCLTLTLAPGGPGCSWVPASPGDLDSIIATVGAAPIAATTLASTLDVVSRCTVADGLVVESLAYSMLLAGPEFAAWRARTPRGAVPTHAEPLLLFREADELSLVLNCPERHNAFGRAVRDGLLEGLRLAEVDGSIVRVLISGKGPSFCSGGDLDEFGTTPDVASAHMIRLQQSAGYAVHRIAGRVVVRTHGACIGAGIEVPAFAGRIEAVEGSWFKLPEVAFGLIPGAGGTVSITQRIGRWRTAYMALTGRSIDLDTALSWGLVDARVERN